MSTQTTNDDADMPAEIDFSKGVRGKFNAHRGSNFDDFLREEGVLDEVQSRALERALAEQKPMP